MIEKKENRRKNIECREQLKLVEKLRPDRPGKILALEKNNFFRPGNSGLGWAGTHGPDSEVLPISFRQSF